MTTLIASRNRSAVPPTLIHCLEQHAEVVISETLLEFMNVMQKEIPRTIIALDSMILGDATIRFIATFFSRPYPHIIHFIIAGDVVRNCDIVMANRLLKAIGDAKWEVSALSFTESVINLEAGELEDSNNAWKRMPSLVNAQSLMLKGVGIGDRLYRPRGFKDYGTVAISDSFAWVGLPCDAVGFDDIIMGIIEGFWLDN